MLHQKLVQNNENCFTALKKFSKKVKENHIKELPIMYGSMEVGKKKKMNNLWILNFLIVITKKQFLIKLEKKIAKKVGKKKIATTSLNWEFVFFLFLTKTRYQLKI